MEKQRQVSKHPTRKVNTAAGAAGVGAAGATILAATLGLEPELAAAIVTVVTAAAGWLAGYVVAPAARDQIERR